MMENVQQKSLMILILHEQARQKAEELVKNEILLWKLSFRSCQIIDRAKKNGEQQKLIL